MRIRMMFLAALAVAACHGKKADTTTGGPAGGGGAKLYDRLGGMDAINPLVKDFVEEQVAKDARINSYFVNADIKGLEKKLADQICEASGGPCKYTGKDMKTAHAGMGIAAPDFDALVEDLKKSLDKFNVKPDDQQTLLGVLGPMKGDIVTK